MKTPREALFERHRQVEPRLDAVRQKVLAALPASGSADALQPCRGERWSIQTTLKKAWFELIWPSRRAWAGMAALWLAVLAVNLEMKATSSRVLAGGSAAAQEIVQAVEQQRRLLAELLPPGKPSAGEPRSVEAPRANPRPRSEGPVPFKAC
ncbi:MAG TPA: hypothetical protein VNZ64_22755 [Candidatus Acidoferrum sp.]|jgi:hypothetical protein|nr:hypothetical protein [Candidatus Acidoferrum sp.]